MDLSDLLASSKSGLERMEGLPVLEPARVGDWVEVPSFWRSAFSRPVTASEMARKPLRSFVSLSLMSEIRWARGMSLGSPSLVIMGAAPLRGSLTIRFDSLRGTGSLVFFPC